MSKKYAKINYNAEKRKLIYDPKVYKEGNISERKHIA